MKQHIVVEQLKEANDCQLKKICGTSNWMKLETNIEWLYLAKKINIGTMIEILESYSKNNNRTFKLFTDITKSSYGHWWVSLLPGDEFVCADKTIWHNKTLCDALWEAVKYTLGSD